MRLPLLLPLLAVGCVPRLYSEADTGPDCPWEPPEANSWYSSAPPEGLCGQGFENGQVIPDMDAVDQHGDPVKLWQFYGQLIMLDLSAEWCGPCQELAEHVDETAEDYVDDGVEYITVIISSTNSQVPPTHTDVQEWSDYFHITQPVLADTEGWWRQLFPTGSAALPRLILVGRDMRIIEDDVQPPNDIGIRQSIERQL